MNYAGQTTPQATFLTSEVHKLHKEFNYAATVEIGQPVKLTSTGQVTPLEATDSAHLSIGHSVHRRVAGQDGTVMMRGFTELTVEASAIQNAGPVKWASYNTTSKRSRYAAAADAATTQGHALEAATAIGQQITVVIL